MGVRLCGAAALGWGTVAQALSSNGACDSREVGDTCEVNAGQFAAANARRGSCVELLQANSRVNDSVVETERVLVCIACNAYASAEVGEFGRIGTWGIFAVGASAGSMFTAMAFAMVWRLRMQMLEQQHNMEIDAHVADAIASTSVSVGNHKSEACDEDPCLVSSGASASSKGSSRRRVRKQAERISAKGTSSASTGAGPISAVHIELGDPKLVGSSAVGPNEDTGAPLAAQARASPIRGQGRGEVCTIGAGVGVTGSVAGLRDAATAPSASRASSTTGISRGTLSASAAEKWAAMEFCLDETLREEEAAGLSERVGGGSVPNSSKAPIATSALVVGRPNGQTAAPSKRAQVATGGSRPRQNIRPPQPAREFSPS